MGDEDLPAVGQGAGPPDEGVLAGQAYGYEEAEDLQPDLSLADPAATA